jgi:hypothetical protein
LVTPVLRKAILHENIATLFDFITQGILTLLGNVVGPTILIDESEITRLLLGSDTCLQILQTAYNAGFFGVRVRIAISRTPVKPIESI